MAGWCFGRMESGPTKKSKTTLLVALGMVAFPIPANSQTGASSDPTAPASTGKPDPVVAAIVPINDSTYIKPIPAEASTVSPGGVDMRTGAYQYTRKELAIGAEGDGGLTLERQMGGEYGHAQAFGRLFSHNWDVRLNQSRVPVPEANTPGQYDYQVSVAYGGLSTSFKARYATTAPYQQNSADKNGAD